VLVDASADFVEPLIFTNIKVSVARLFYERDYKTFTDFRLFFNLMFTRVFFHNFSRGGAKVVKFVFFPLKTKKTIILVKIFTAPLPTPMQVSTMLINVHAQLLGSNGKQTFVCGCFTYRSYIALGTHLPCYSFIASPTKFVSTVRLLSVMWGF